MRVFEWKMGMMNERREAASALLRSEIGWDNAINSENVPRGLSQCHGRRKPDVAGGLSHWHVLQRDVGKNNDDAKGSDGMTMRKMWTVLTEENVRAAGRLPLLSGIDWGTSKM